MTNNNTDLFLQNINTQSQEEWKNYERSLNFLLNNDLGKKYLVLFGITQGACVASFLQKSIQEEDDKTISYIGARIFNDGMVALRSCLNGYYQIAMSLVRDLVEIQFLLDYFSLDRTQINVWRSQSNSERYKNFAPHVLYKKLDERDGWTNERRKTTYQMFCENAAHVSYAGIRLMTDDAGVVSMGSFYNEKKLINTVVEIVRRHSHAVMSAIALLPNREIPAIKAQLELMDKFAEVFNLDINKNPKYLEGRKIINDILTKRGV